MERTIPKNGKKEKSCVLLKELSKIYDIMKLNYRSGYGHRVIYPVGRGHHKL